MELRFRSDDNGSSSGFPVSSNDNFFTEQALHGGYGMSGARIPELMRNSTSVELFHREVEKRRIREEIMAGEIRRRQTLEAEVRRELAMERGLGFQREEGLSVVTNLPMWSDQNSSSLMHHINHHSDDSRAFDERVSFLSGQQVGRIENSPFQRHPDAAKVTEINKGRVLFIPKPTSNVAGIKRKLASIGGTGFLANSKKFVKKDWACDLCQVRVTCEQGLNDHIKGKKHRMNEAALKANAAAVSKDTSSSVTSEKKSDNPEAEAKEITCGPKPNEKKVSQVIKGEALCQQTQKTDNTKNKFKYWCECCQIGCHSPAVMADHEGGKKHQTRLRLQDGEDVQAAIVSITVKNATSEKITEYSAGKEAIKDASEKMMESIGEIDVEQAHKEEEKQYKNANDETSIEYSVGKEAIKEVSEETLEYDIGAEEAQEEEEKQCKNAEDEKTTEYPPSKEASGEIMENVVGEIDREDAQEEEENSL
ncbi:hypothetical protein MKW94_011861 [Papaver nudicaule]|uniref:C2H2-type domain-containing protein n=1 Tax=Papaver nudicaule TaxID=74823 RepID=A0AA42B470_PAPNU|nr:hypothetical protein [Papaver nudicaule]